jgi:hypothetical protein
MSAAFTPGPWQFADLHVDLPDGYIVAKGANAKANARLISTAPDMHALLVTALDLVPHMNADDPLVPALLDWCRDASAVLMKAKP